MELEDEEIINVSAIEHFAYCPRRCALMSMEDTFEDNLFTLEGAHLHERADTPLTTREGDKRVERALPLWSRRLGLVGRADVVEFGDDGTVFPIEYKRGKRGRKRFDELQLCAQALCLEEMLGVEVPRGAIFYHRSRRAREVTFDENLREETLRVIQRVRQLLRSGRVPPPPNDSRCPDCSLHPVCLPNAIQAAAREKADDLFVPLQPGPPEEGGEP